MRRVQRAGPLRATAKAGKGPWSEKDDNSELSPRQGPLTSETTRDV